VTNHEVAAALRAEADRRERSGVEPHRVQAYRRAANSIETAQDVTYLARSGRLQDVNGVGERLSAWITRLIYPDGW